MNHHLCSLGELIKTLQAFAANVGPDVAVLIETPNSDEYGLYQPVRIEAADLGGTVFIQCTRHKKRSEPSRI